MKGGGFCSFHKKKKGKQEGKFFIWSFRRQESEEMKRLPMQRESKNLNIKQDRHELKCTNLTTKKDN